MLDHPKIFECFSDCFFLLRWALGLLGVFGFRLIVVLTLNDAVFLLHLCDIEVGNPQLMMFPYMLPNLIVSCLAFRSSHIQLIHADVHFDVPLDMEFGQKENGFAMCRR